jgi:lysophospholipase L1-like esterase
VFSDTQPGSECRRHSPVYGVTDIEGGPIAGRTEKGHLIMRATAMGWGTGLVAAALFLGVTPASASPIDRPLQVTAIGDSYASGVGAGDYEPGTTGVCWRSANSASTLVAAKLRQSTGRKVTFTNRTCSGAAIKDLSEPFKGEPAQLDSLTPGTDLVLLTIGTNDVEFAEFGGLCLQADCAGTPTQAELRKMPALVRDLIGLLRTIHARSPRATVVLSGYGQQLSTRPNAQGVTLDPICAAGVITDDERRDGNTVSAAIDLSLRAAVLAVGLHGVRTDFVSPYAWPGQVRPEFANHSLCQSGAPFYRGFDALAPGQEGSEAVFHLNQPGQATMATLVERELHLG